MEGDIRILDQSLTSFLFAIMKLNGMAIYPDTLETLERAVRLKYYKFLIDKSGEASGFLTWELEGEKIWVMNLTIFPNKRGIVDLFHLRTFFRDKYPGSKFGWHNDKRLSLIEQK